MIIASDVLYDPSHPKLLSHAISRLASPHCKLVFSCPGRGYKNRFSRKLARQGFHLEERPLAFSADEKPPYKGRILIYRRRSHASQPA